jgi:hypothetical protein
MQFVQLMEFSTSKADELQGLEREWEAATEGKRTLRRSVIARDRHDPSRHVVLAFFDSYDAAMVNSELPETQEFAKRQGELVDGEMTFRDLDVIDDRSA